MIYTCTKTFKISNISNFEFTKNKKYYLKEFGEQSNVFYAGPISNNQTTPMYWLDIKHREFFITEKQMRKLKLKEIYDKI